MINEISLNAIIKIHAKIARQPWGRLWYWCRAIDSDHKGRVYILVPEILTFLNISRATFYRWLKEGKEAGAFREYKRIGKHKERIILGGKTAVCEKLKITNWDSVTEVPLWSLLGDSNIPLCQKKKPTEKKFRQWITLFQAHWMQLRSIKAAIDKEAKRIRNKKHRRKPYQPKFNKPLKTPDRHKEEQVRQPTDFSGANGQPTSQIKRAKQNAFSRRHIHSGASQRGIGESLGISECSVRRHLNGVERVQVMYKVNPLEGKEALFNAQETWEKSLIFERKGEYFKYGCNLYDLNFTQKSEFTQRVKYKFSLWMKNFLRGPSTDKLSLCKKFKKKDLIKRLEEFKSNVEFELDSLDHICLDVLITLKNRSFKCFFEEVKRELRRLRKTGEPPK